MFYKLQHNTQLSCNMDLFKQEEQKKDRIKNLPLAVKMRPQNLDEFAGQDHILSKGKLLRRCIETDKITSVILYGPPGTGKTSLAHIIHKTTNSLFYNVNAVTSNIAEIRKILGNAKKQIKIDNRKTILFIDEVHRFNKAQQDILIPEVENADIILIGATTHNPFFSIVSPLISRSLIFELKPLEDKHINYILDNALSNKKGLAHKNVFLSEDAKKFIAKNSNGDARIALNALEIGVMSTPANNKGVIALDLNIVKECMQKKLVRYGKNKDEHYDIISAYIKSIRGSDPDAAIYWMARMLYAGEDPLFIARRLVIAAAEDIGNANPNALNIANSAMQITQFIGMPECQIPLAQATIYLACSPKSNASYKAVNKAMEDIKNKRIFEVPQHLKESNYKGADKLGRGKGYKYSHDYKDHYVEQGYMPESIKYYYPTKLGYEINFYERLKKLRQENE